MKDLPFASTKQKRSKRTEGMSISKCLQGKLVLLHDVGFYPSANQYDAFEKKIAMIILSLQGILFGETINLNQQEPEAYLLHHLKLLYSLNYLAKISRCLARN